MRVGSLCICLYLFLSVFVFSNSRLMIATTMFAGHVFKDLGADGRSIK
jgi:hypothetical protein